jgi:hypothetical protein
VATILSTPNIKSLLRTYIYPPANIFELPDSDGRLNNTKELAYCLSLLQSSHSPDDILDPTIRDWLQATEKNTDEQERLMTLAINVIREFKHDELKDVMAVTEVLHLVPVLEKDTFRDLLRVFYSRIEQSSLLDVHHLEGLAQLIQGAKSGSLDADDLVKILELLNEQLRDTHHQSSHYIYQLTVTVSHVLDAMADTDVKGLDREKLHEPLMSYLERLKGSSDSYLVFQAAYAYQALQYVPDDETLWQKTLRHTGKVIQGVSGIVSAVKGLDLNGFVDGLKKIQQGAVGAFEVAQLIKSTYKEATSLKKDGKDFLDCLKEGFSFERKREWYPALRGADVFIRGGQLLKFERLVYEAPCQHDPAFQWGVCQRLGEIAANTMWAVEARRSAVMFLGEIYKNDTAWSRHACIKQWVINILLQLSSQTGSVTHGMLD